MLTWLLLVTFYSFLYLGFAQSWVNDIWLLLWDLQSNIRCLFSSPTPTCFFTQSPMYFANERFKAKTCCQWDTAINSVFRWYGQLLKHTPREKTCEVMGSIHTRRWVFFFFFPFHSNFIMQYNSVLNQVPQEVASLLIMRGTVKWYFQLCCLRQKSWIRTEWNFSKMVAWLGWRHLWRDEEVQMAPLRPFWGSRWGKRWCSEGRQSVQGVVGCLGPLHGQAQHGPWPVSKIIPNHLAYQGLWDPHSGSSCYHFGIFLV